MRYASDTSVSVEKSRAEIETILKRYGATHFAYMSMPDGAAVAFRISERNVRFVLPLPDPKAKEFTHTTAQGFRRTPENAHKMWEQACRQKWRALVLCIKAKLEAVESKIATLEDEFLAYIVLPDGKTVSEIVTPSLAAIYEGRNVPLLPDYTNGADR